MAMQLNWGNLLDQRGQKGQVTILCTLFWSSVVSKVSLSLVHLVCLRLTLCVWVSWITLFISEISIISFFGYVQYVQWQYVQYVQICSLAVNVKSVEGTFTHSFGHFYQLLCQSVISISLIYHCIILKKKKIKLSIHHLCRSFTMITITTGSTKVQQLKKLQKCHLTINLLHPV